MSALQSRSVHLLAGRGWGGSQSLKMPWISSLSNQLPMGLLKTTLMVYDYVGNESLIKRPSGPCVRSF